MPGLAFGTQYRYAIAKQTAEGTAATVGEYEVPLYSGQLAPEETRAEHEVTDTLAYRRGSYKQSAQAAGSIVIPSFHDAGPRFAHGILSTDTVTGAADPFTHTLTRADSRPWFTAWLARPKPDATLQWDRFEDCRIKAVEYQFAAGQVVKQMVEFVGKKAVGNVTAPTITTTKNLDAAGPWHTMIGATLKLDIDATPAVTQIRSVLSGSFRFEYPDLSLVQTDELTPRFEDRGLFRAGFNAEILLENYEAYLATFFGSKSASAASPSTTVVRGAIDLLFDVGAAANANRTLQLKLPEVAFTTTPPEPDPSGSGVRTSLVGPMHHPSSGEPITVIYKSAVSASY